MADRQQMQLGIATHFAHGGSYKSNLFSTIAQTGADFIRDGLSWAQAETEAGQYVFDDRRAGYLDQALAAGLDPIVTLLPHRNTLYQHGDTVTRADGIAAFADFVAATLDRFPGLTRIEIGNEFNTPSRDFVSGQALTSDMAERAQIYTDILAAVHDRIAAGHPEVQLIGGALHSVATGYVQHLADAGAFAHMDALAFHPYGLAPERVGDSIAALNTVLSQLPEDQRPELVVTEFGRSEQAGDALGNADYMAKMVAEMGARGVTDATWYALLDEDASAFPDMGLYDRPGTANAALDGFRFVAGLLDGGAAPEDVSQDGTIRMFDFGQDTMLVWGSYQEVAFSGRNLVFRDAAGHVIDRPAAVSDAAIYVTGQDLALQPAAGRVIADSFYEFDLAQSGDGGWSQHGEKQLRGKVTEVDLSLMGGQERYGESWNPYLGNDYWRPFSMTADTVRPMGYGTSGRNERLTVDRYTAEADGHVDIVGSWQVDAASTDGVGVTVTLNGRQLYHAAGQGDLSAVLRDITLNAGDRLDFKVDDNGDSSGDTTLRHIRILAHDAGQSDAALLARHLAHDVIDGNEIPMPPAGEESALLRQPANAPDPSLPARNAIDWHEGTDGADLMRSSAGDLALAGGAGDDKLVGRGFDEILDGGAGRDKVIGGAGDDLLFGGEGADRLAGGRGDDTLQGGAGRDVLVGHDGADVFRFGLADLGETDLLRDFDAAEGDVLDLRGLGGVSALDLVDSRKGAVLHAEIDGLGHDIVLLQGHHGDLSLDALAASGQLLL